jgi:hypothetical protein
MGVEQHTRSHGMTFAGEKAMTRLFDVPPPIDYMSLDGKTLTIRVGVDYNPETNLRTTVVVGEDAQGHMYVLVDKQETLHVHPE